MNNKHCLRCGSTELQLGFIEEDYQKSRIMFRWKSESTLGTEAVLLNAILCISCGHTELIADLGVFTPGTRRKCPHCQAIYSYRKEDELSPRVVRCPNCNKEFGNSEEADRVIDDIE